MLGQQAISFPNSLYFISACILPNLVGLRPCLGTSRPYQYFSDYSWMEGMGSSLIFQGFDNHYWRLKTNKQQQTTLSSFQRECASRGWVSCQMCCFPGSVTLCLHTHESIVISCNLPPGVNLFHCMQAPVPSSRKKTTLAPLEESCISPSISLLTSCKEDRRGKVTAYESRECLQEGGKKLPS